MYLRRLVPNPRSTQRRRREFVTCIPPTPAELAAASVRWEQRGLLGRLVRLEPAPQRDALNR